MLLWTDVCLILHWVCYCVCNAAVGSGGNTEGSALVAVTVSGDVVDSTGVTLRNALVSDNCGGTVLSCGTNARQSVVWGLWFVGQGLVRSVCCSPNRLDFVYPDSGQVASAACKLVCLQLSW